jgi:hypothetical protein
MGLVFRNIPSHGDNADKIQFMQQMYRFSLTGHFPAEANGSTLIANGSVEWINSVFWTQYYEMLWHMAQRRDGYRATAAPPLGEPLLPREVFELAVTANINIRVIDAVYGALLVNEGMRSMIEGFDDINPDRITRGIERCNQMMYPDWLAPIVSYWGQIYSKYPGGPIVIPLFDFQAIEDLLVPASGSYTAWTGNPDFAVAANINSMLDDIDLACTQILDGNCADLADLDNFQSIQDMMGHVMPAPPRTSLIVDEIRWKEQYESLGMYVEDNKGAGVDTHTFWPDMRGSEDQLVNVQLNGINFDELYWIGAKGIYAYDADDDDNPGYTAKAADLTAYGLVCRIKPSATIHELDYVTRFYTREDGVAELAAAHDITSAAGCQTLFWQFPWETCHPENWRQVMSEEAEEIYKLNFRHPGVQVPAGTWARAYREFLIQKSQMPFVV